MDRSSSDDLLRRLCPPRKRYLMAVLVGLGCLMFYSTILSSFQAQSYMISRPRPISGTSNTTNTTKIASICNLPRIRRDYMQFNRKPYKWTKDILVAVRTAYFVPHILGHLAGAILLTRFSAKRVFGFSVLGTGLFTFLIPIFLFQVHTDYITVLVCQVVVGICCAIAFTGAHAVLGFWAPARDRDRLAGIVFSLLHFGLALRQILGDLVISSKRDPVHIFYTFGGITMGWFALWMLLGKSNYEECADMTMNERNYMKREMGHGVVFRPTKIPWRKMATSKPLWALCIASMGEGAVWQMSLFVLAPFMRFVFNYDLRVDFRFQTLPHINTAVGILVVGFSSGWIINKGYVQRTTARKICTTIGSMGPTIFLVGMTHAGCNRDSANLLMTVGLPLASFRFSGTRINTLDLAPNFSGTLMALAHACEMIPGLITPFIVKFVGKGTSIRHWILLYWCMAILMAFTNLVFVLFGSAEVQSWNYLDEEDKKVTYYDNESEMTEDEYSLDESPRAGTSSTD